MKYLVFIGSRYYPSGGWDDAKGFASTIEDALDIVESCMGDYYEPWYHVIDAQTGIKVLEHG